MQKGKEGKAEMNAVVNQKQTNRKQILMDNTESEDFKQHQIAIQGFPKITASNQAYKTVNTVTLFPCPRYYFTTIQLSTYFATNT